MRQPDREEAVSLPSSAERRKTFLLRPASCNRRLNAGMLCGIYELWTVETPNCLIHNSFKNASAILCQMHAFSSNSVSSVMKTDRESCCPLISAWKESYSNKVLIETACWKEFYERMSLEGLISGEPCSCPPWRQLHSQALSWHSLRKCTRLLVRSL